MRMLTKEFHQQKWMLLGGCLAGLIFPAIEYWMFHRSDMPYEGYSGAYVVYLAGAFYGILLALVAAYPDARRGASDFLLAKPINCSHIFVAKALVAAVALPLAMTIVAAPDFITTFGRSEHFALAWAILSTTCPLAIMLFSLTVLLVVITQDQGKSLVLAIWAAVLIYFLPPMLNGFAWLSTLKHIDNTSQSLLLHLLGPRFEALVPLIDSPEGPYGRQAAPPFIWREMLPYLAYVCAMAVAAVTFTWLAVVAMKKRWHWQPDHKTVVWAVGLASLFISAQIVFHVGYNLRPATEMAGRKIQNPSQFETFPFDNSVCFKDDLIFSVGIVNQHVRDPNTDEETYLQHTVLNIYRFPYADTPNSLLSILYLSKSPCIVPKWVSIGVMDSWVKDNWLYAFYYPLVPDPQKKNDVIEGDTRIVAVDIASPTKPVLSGELIINPSSRHFPRGNVAVKGNYCYVNTGANLDIVSLEMPGEPRLVKEVSYASLAPTFKQGRMPMGAFIYRFTVVDNMLLFSADNHLGAFDISDPTNPRTLFIEDIRKLGLPVKDWYLTTWDGDYCYLAGRNGFYVARLLKGQGDGYSLKYIGHRKTTPLEKMAGFQPCQLIVYNGYLVEAADRFGLIVYDISDPAHPKRLYHADTPYIRSLDIYNGLLCTRAWGNTITFFYLPKAP